MPWWCTRGTLLALASTHTHTPAVTGVIHRSVGAVDNFATDSLRAGLPGTAECPPWCTPPQTTSLYLQTCYTGQMRVPDSWPAAHEFACTQASCRPPTSGGTGGSVSKRASSPPDEEFVDLYHNTNSVAHDAIVKTGKFRGKAGWLDGDRYKEKVVFFTTDPNSSYAKLFGSKQIHVRMPKALFDRYAVADDSNPNPGVWFHYAVPVKYISSEHIIITTPPT